MPNFCAASIKLNILKIVFALILDSNVCYFVYPTHKIFHVQVFFTEDIYVLFPICVWNKTSIAAISNKVKLNKPLVWPKFTLLPYCWSETRTTDILLTLPLD